ncbi:hypothetical protein M409DRAFT_54501 [Zasmidium cellare ATCC 36951]|uniref:Uncharacterized protein n=1 Tax=Zasmidium cellare ATCC 36951 TaxID=1080233 RepID=A0A6A6CHH9_ZASCE|nr:uncharacterized protein M409DRAFT_54501 [Zasmidium cellare ATCC 36951]KAF2166707.1 hypothetical protein M409DRAFT_54501 [Zasmidium cellare ATCC 36951]
MASGPFSLALFLLQIITVCADAGIMNAADDYQKGSYGDAPAQRYLSDPDIWSPIFNAPIWNRSAVSIAKTPHLLMSLEYESRMGPYLFSSDDLSLIYANRNFAFVNNVRVQRYRGETVLTFWEGMQGKGHAQGVCVALNKHYEIVFNVTSSVSFSADADLHECEVTRDDTVLITIYESTAVYNLSSVGGKEDDVLLDSCFEEIKPDTGEVWFGWRASWFFHPTASYHDYEPVTHNGWDPWHINSLQKIKEGDYIVDLRRAHTVVLINGTDGWPIWNLGGKGNDFEDLSDGQATAFAWQHHARFLDDDLTQLTMFDNHQLEWEKAVGCTGPGCSRGLRLELTHFPEKTVKLVEEHLAPSGLGCYAMGSYDALPNGNSLVGWDSQAGFTEYGPDGTAVMDAAFGRFNTNVRTYRVFKDTWVGLPNWNPKLALDAVSGNVLASWNGATEVVSWVVMVANRRETLVSIDSRSGADESATIHAAKKGFETSVAVGGALDKFQYVRAAALDVAGTVIGATDLVNVADGNCIEVASLPDTRGWLAVRFGADPD